MPKTSPNSQDKALEGAAPHTLAELIDTFCERADAPAIVSFHGARTEVLSYRELSDEIRRYAAGLRDRGIGPDHLVVLWAGNSPQWVIAYFAIVGAGAAAVPLDNHAASAQAAGALAHARPSLILTTRAHLEELDSIDAVRDVDRLLLDAPESGERSWRSVRAAEPAAVARVDEHALASLLYTSGTTGTPKGVPLTHANLASNLAALLEAHLVDPDDRVLMPLPLHHTYPFTVGLLTVLGTGAALILPAGISGPEIGRAAVEGRATVLLAVPRLCSALWDTIYSTVRARGRFATRAFLAMLEASLRVRRFTGLPLGRLLFRPVHKRLGGRLKLIGCGGAKLDAELERRLEGLGLKVLTGYGLTETSPVLTFNRPHDRKPGSEGRPVPGVELRIEPAADQPHGEISARGENVFDGYWQDPDQTRAAFTDDGWFRTGDLGWLDEDGFLHVSGRSKEVIVLPDGKNVFPEEVEKVYGEDALFREVAVLQQDNGLAALIVPDEEAVRRRGALREAALLREELEALGHRLAPYQRVSTFRVTREPLPRTQLGKLKRHLLPAIYEGASREGRRPAAQIGAEDRRLLESEPARSVWRWLEQRYPEQELALDTSPQLDLQIDSLEWVTLTLEIERTFRVALTGEAVSRVVTLRDLLREIEAAPPAEEREAGEARGVVVEPPGPLLRLVGAILFAFTRVAVRILFRLRVSGLERLPAQGAVVFTPNHASYLDPLAMAAALPWARLRKTFWAGWVGTMYTGPVSSFVSRATQVFPVDPDRDLAGAIETARSLLNRGYSIVWFPEGRRSPNGALEPFLPGIGLLLEGSHATIVPTAIGGTFEAWPRHRRAPRPRPVSVTFGRSRSPEELRAAGRGKTGAEQLAAALQAEVEALLAPSGTTDGSGGNSHGP